MDIALRSLQQEFKSAEFPESRSAVRQVYMECAGEKIVTLTREDLRQRDADAAISELRDWLMRHENDAGLADLCTAIELAVKNAQYD
jgi:hypothetical protein